MLAAPSPLLYLVGLLLLTLLAFAGRTFLVGVREQVVKAVVNTAVEAMLGGIKTGIQDLKDDMKLVKTSQESARQANLLTNTDLSAMRQRLDDHLTTDETRFSILESWIKSHTHGTATAQDLT